VEVIKEIKKIEPSTGMDGFMVITNLQEIKLGINNNVGCCEHWGHFWCNDQPQEFVGAHVIGVMLTNKALITEKAPKVYESEVLFVNIETDRGVLQFVCYNSHNGYYGHLATVTCDQLKHTVFL